MEKEFVPAVQALELKELGFDEPCFMHYENSILFQPFGDKDFYKNSELEFQEISAPLFQQAFSFFREKYQLFSEILVDKTSSPKFSYKITEFEGNPKNLSEKEWDWKPLFSDGLFRTYAETELECIKKLIEITQNTNK